MYLRIEIYLLGVGKEGNFSLKMCIKLIHHAKFDTDLHLYIRNLKNHHVKLIIIESLNLFVFVYEI